MKERLSPPKKSLRRSLRMSHVLIFAAFLVLSARLHDMTHTLEWGTPAHGENPPSPEPKPQDSPKEKPTSKPDEKKEKDSPQPEPSKNSEQKNLPPSSEKKEAEKPLKKASDKPNDFDLLEMSPKEIQMLQSLLERKSQLEKEETHLHQKSGELKVITEQINQKITHLSALQENLKKLLHEYNSQDQQKNRNVAKIYEDMKPKDAARIFEILDMPMILDMMENMKESKISSILSNVKPEKAKEITARFLERRKMASSSY